MQAFVSVVLGDVTDASGAGGAQIKFTLRRAPSKLIAMANKKIDIIPQWLKVIDWWLSTDEF